MFSYDSTEVMDWGETYQGGELTFSLYHTVLGTCYQHDLSLANLYHLVKVVSVMSLHSKVISFLFIHSSLEVSH